MRATATKAGRLELQKFQFESLVNKGYSRENYGDLVIFTMTDNTSTWLKVFRGTASKEIEFKRYRTAEQCSTKVKDLKASNDRRKAYKAELKANPTKSSSANCATAIREELKKEFDGVKFSVKSSNFSGGDSVHISWVNGPITDDVRRITDKYQYGRFDGMTDMYEYSNSREDLPQSKYVQNQREISDEINEIAFNYLKGKFSDNTPDYEIKQYCYRIISKTSIPIGATVTGLAETNQSGSIEDCFTLTFLLPETSQKEAKTAPEFEKVEVPAGEVQIVDYSEKAIAVIGDTKPIKDKLKDLGGKFNFRLSCGAGWIFPKSKLSEIEKIFSGGTTTEEAEEKLKENIQEMENLLSKFKN